MIRTSNAEIIAGFEATIPEAEKGVIGCAKVVEMYSGNAGGTEVLLHYARLMFFVSQVDFDIRVSLRNLLADPATRITTEKYLALALIEAERGAGKLLNQLRLAASKQHGRCAEFLDLRLFQEARDALDARLKPMRDDKPFMSDLTLIRNEVVAHFVSRGSGVEGSAMWALSRGLSATMRRQSCAARSSSIPSGCLWEFANCRAVSHSPPTHGSAGRAAASAIRINAPREVSAAPIRIALSVSTVLPHRRSSSITTTYSCQRVHNYWMHVYSGFVITREAALATLNSTDVARGIAWAYATACEQILADFTRSAGYKALSAGVGRYEVLADRLDRVFSCGDYVVTPGEEDAGLDVLYEGLSEYARKTMPVIPPGVVTRKNLNKSNGWAVDGFRFVTFSFDLGGLHKIDWTTEKPTRKKVAKQAPRSAAMGTLFDLLHESEVAHLGESETMLGLGMPTLVLGHALSLATGDRELIIGHSRYNEDHGDPWHWERSLLDGNDGGAISRPTTAVPSTNDEPDAPVRLRTKAAEENVQ